MHDSDHESPVNASNPSTAHGSRQKEMLSAILERLSSVRLGITMMIVLFFYSWLGSAGLFYPVFAYGGVEWRHVMVRQFRIFEMTEFEWFHTWFFIANCAAICLNLTVVTLRKIPFNAMKLGVWMIHSGVIILAIGSVMYFMLKVEGDSPVVRRSIQIEIPGSPGISMPALLGSSATLDTEDGVWEFEVTAAIPEYELLTEGLEGTATLSVTVQVVDPQGETFFRQLLDGLPEYTEDAIRVDPASNNGRPFIRVKQVESYGGASLVEPALQMRLVPLAQQYFWVKDTFAIAHRKAGSSDPWTQHAINGMPRYNDYVPSQVLDTVAARLVWPPTGVDQFPLFGLDLPVAGGVADGGFHVHGYLRYAVMQERWLKGPVDEPMNPVADIAVVLPDGTEVRRQLAAFDDDANESFEGRIGLRWVDTEDELRLLSESAGTVSLKVEIDGSESVHTLETPPVGDEQEPEFIDISDTGYAFRVRQLNLDLQIDRDAEPVDLVVIEYQTPGGDVVTRWVFGDPQATVDLDPARAEAEGSQLGTVAPDPAIVTTLLAGEPDHIIAIGSAVDGAVLLDERNPFPGATIVPDQRIDLGGVELELRSLHMNAVRDSRPVIVPRSQRDADVERGLLAAHALVEFETEAGPRAEWVRFHTYSFDDPRLWNTNLGAFDPLVYTAPDGSEREMILTRIRLELPTPVALDDFNLIAHVGGFTGETGSIRDWQSVVRFGEDFDTAEPVTVRVNGPQEHGGMWYFQSFWDAPRQGIPGKLFTGLGVGNREGVFTALFGSTLTVIGMIYTFYVKPIIQRRRSEAIRRVAVQGEQA